MTEQIKSHPRFSLITKNTTLTVRPPDNDGRIESRAETYLKKCDILKQIMSNKARSYRKINAWQNGLTVVVSSLLLFIGFSGLEKIATYVSWVYPIKETAAELGFNFLVFLLFVIGILHLVFHFSQKQSAAEKGVAALAALANEIEDMITSRGNLVISDEPARVDLIRARYEGIAENLPANSDKDFLKAKRDLASKESKKPTLAINPQRLFDPTHQEEIVASIALGSRSIVDALLALRTVNSDLFLGGGLIRNAVWDYLHGYKTPTSVDDVDVIHFDGLNKTKEHDESLRQRLALHVPNTRWSVKNQARMHDVNGEDPYLDLQDAVSRWPETATAFLARLQDDGSIEFIAPHGFDDLLRLLIKNTPAFGGRTAIIRDRMSEKKWLSLWPRLRVELA